MKIQFCFLGLIIGLLFSLGAYSQNPNKDLVYLKNGEVFSGTLVEISHHRYIRLMIDDEYLEVLMFSDIEKVVQNQCYDKPFDQLLLTSNESVSGIILEIKTDDYITFKHDILGDTIRISYDQVKTILHKKKKLDPVLRANYLGDYHYFSVGPGGGISYGGLGVRIQYRVGRRFGLGLHVGGGITLESFFKADPYYNMGMKFFFLTYAYLDFSYGITGTSYKKIPPYLNGNEIAINSTGFSALIGTDYFINKYFGVNIAFGLVIPTKKLKYGPQYVFDAGVVFKFPLRKHKK